MRAHGILCVGRVYCDLIFTDVPRLPSMGTEVFAGGLGLHTGGGAPITASHLAALGRPVALAATLPAPPFDRIVAADLAAAEIDVTLCAAAPPGAEPQVTVVVTDVADRAFLTRRAGPAAPELAAEDLRRLGIGHVHVGELATLIEAPRLAALAREAGATLSVDCSWDEAITAERVAPLANAADVFLPNEAEAERMAGLGLAGPLAPLTVVKCGAAGARAEAGGACVSARAATTEVRDTTGAGDAFNAGFLDAWLAGAPLERCLAAGNAAGARAIAVRGGFARPAGPVAATRAAAEALR
jgi:sugar/nucleoside kinase (ribokinase family)